MRPALKTRLSSKDQVIIPEEVRTSLDLCLDAQSKVVGEQDRIILKLIAETSLEKFDHLVNKTQIQTRQAKLKKSDIKTAIKKARKQNE